MMDSPLWCTVVFVLLSAPVTYAQSGVLTGKALDSSHVPVVGVRISLKADVGGKMFTAITNSSGVYRFSVGSGQYMLRVEGDAPEHSIVIAPDNVSTLDLVVTQPRFFDEPQFTVAGVTDNTYRGGHGSDTVLRSSEDLAKATASLASSDTPAKAAVSAEHPLEAVQELQRIAESDPSEPNLFAWGIELLDHLAPQAARDVFQKGARLFPDSTRMLLGLATACYASGSYEQAAHWYFRAADLDPSDSSPYLFLGKVQAHEITELSDYEQRMARFAKLHPGNALANYYYAVTIWHARQSPEAKQLLEKAIALDPHLASAFLELGMVYAADARYPEAINAYRRAITENSNLVEAHFRLSDAYRITGDHLKAARELAIYRDLSEQSAEKLEQERRSVQQFVIVLRETGQHH